jgi:hypothetical protein
MSGNRTAGLTYRQPTLAWLRSEACSRMIILTARHAALPAPSTTSIRHSRLLSPTAHSNNKRRNRHHARGASKLHRGGKAMRGPRTARHHTLELCGAVAMGDEVCGTATWLVGTRAFAARPPGRTHVPKPHHVHIHTYARYEYERRTTTLETDRSSSCCKRIAPTHPCMVVGQGGTHLTKRDCGSCLGSQWRTRPLRPSQTSGQPPPRWHWQCKGALATAVIIHTNKRDTGHGNEATATPTSDGGDSGAAACMRHAACRLGMHLAHKAHGTVTRTQCCHTQRIVSHVVRQHPGRALGIRNTPACFCIGC